MVNGTPLTHAEIVGMRDKSPGYLEFDKYVDMLIVIGPYEHGGELFTCRHWDPVTKMCNGYVGRPELCSDYPYREACRHCWLTHTQLNGRELEAASST